MSDEIKDTRASETTSNTDSQDREPRKYVPRTGGGRPSRDGDGPREGGSDRGGYKNKTAKKKVCRFCAEGIPVDYKNTRVLKSFITERSKIVPARITGTCATHQRELTSAVKRARTLSLLAYTSCHKM